MMSTPSDSLPVSRRIGLALVGTGPGSVPHLASLNDLRHRADLLQVVARRPEAAKLGAFSGQITPTADLAQALNDPQVQAVIVCTPPATHLDLVSQCLAAGKHVLLEKPLDISLERSRSIAQLGRSHGLRLGVVLQHRFREGAVRLRQLLTDGRLGDVQFANVHVPWWRPQQGYYDQMGRGSRARDGGGVLITQAIHTLDLFRSLVGISQVVAAQVGTTAVHTMETEDLAHALLRLGNGAPGVLTATTAMYPGLRETIEIAGTRGTAVLAGGDLTVQFHDGTQERVVQAPGGTGGGANIMDFPHDWHRDLIADFLDALLQNRDPLVTAEDALATHQVIDDILRVSGYPSGA
jgi:predicted dehydrogenase